MTSDKMVVTSHPATKSSIQKFAEGDRFQAGGQHDLEDRGLGSGVGVHQRGANDPAVKMPEVPELPAFVQDAPVEAPEQNFQQMYGQSENEKGKWRKTAEEAMNELAQMKTELAGMRAASATPGYTTPQPTYPQVAQPTVASQLPETFFPDRSENDIVEIKDVDAMLKNLVAPAVLQLNQQQQYLQQQAAQTAKVSAGITPAIEQQLIAECPWVQQVPDGPARVQAMQGLMQQRQAAQPTAAPQPQSTQVNPEQAAARRVTYVESGGAATPHETEIPLQQRVAQEWAGAKTAKQKRDILIKYGMQHANDWGPDVWGPVR